MLAGLSVATTEAFGDAGLTVLYGSDGILCNAGELSIRHGVAPIQDRRGDLDVGWIASEARLGPLGLP